MAENITEAQNEAAEKLLLSITELAKTHTRPDYVTQLAEAYALVAGNMPRESGPVRLPR